MSLLQHYSTNKWTIMFSKRFPCEGLATRPVYYPAFDLRCWDELQCSCDHRRKLYREWMKAWMKTDFHSPRLPWILPAVVLPQTQSIGWVNVTVRMLKTCRKYHRTAVGFFYTFVLGFICIVSVFHCSFNIFFKITVLIHIACQINRQVDRQTDRQIYTINIYLNVL